MSKRIKNIILITVSLFCTAAYAQDKSGGIKENVKGSQFVIDFTNDSWVNSPTSMDIKWYSRGFNFYFMQHIPLGESNFGVGIGVGIGNSNIYHNAVIGVDTAGGTVFTPRSTTFRKNKIATTFLDVPVELRFRSEANESGNSFNLGLGFKGGYLINNHIKYHGVDPSGLTANIKVKEFDLPNIYSWRFGPTLRIGYGKFNVLAYYGLNTIFSEGEGDKAKLLSIGLTFTLP